MNFQQIRDFVNPAVAQATGLQEVDNLQMPVPTAHLMQPGGGGSITVDSELSDTSTNPVENRVITAALNNVFATDIFAINVTVPLDAAPIVDKTFAEMQDAIFAGKYLVLCLKLMHDEDGNHTTNIYRQAMLIYDDNGYIDRIIFSTPLARIDQSYMYASYSQIIITAADGLQAPTTVDVALRSAGG